MDSLRRAHPADTENRGTSAASHFWAAPRPDRMCGLAKIVCFYRHHVHYDRLSDIWTLSVELVNMEIICSL
jgi:hypothetical protein